MSNWRSNVNNVGIIILGHGSRAEETADRFREYVANLSLRFNSDKIRFAALQFDEQNLPTTIESLIEDGAEKVVVIPFFLMNGNHMKFDIPEIIEQAQKVHPSIEIHVARPIGHDLRLLEIVSDMILAETLHQIDTCELSPAYRIPIEIENESFSIIDVVIENGKVNEVEQDVIKRIVHACGDPSIVQAIEISDGAIENGIQALQQGSNILCDVKMVKSGIKTLLENSFDNALICRIDDEYITSEANKLGKTRCAVAMRQMSELMNNAIIVIGNAPTALFEVIDIVAEGNIKPALVIGMPVGFVGAAESKELLRRSELNYITICGTRGGTPMAVAATNALIKRAACRQHSQHNIYIES